MISDTFLFGAPWIGARKIIVSEYLSLHSILYFKPIEEYYIYIQQVDGGNISVI